MANVKKKSKVVMLPTEKAGAGSLIINEYAHMNKSMWKQLTGNAYFTQEYLKSIPAKSFHLYITSDETPKDGDWVTTPNPQIPIELVTKNTYLPHYNKKRKIIATTDSSLMHLSNNGRVGYPLPQPSPQFIEKYIEAYNADNPIVDVMVEYETKHEFIKLGIGPKKFLPRTLLKVDKNNFITITKCKESWSRDEVECLLKKSFIDRFDAEENQANNWTLDKWIEDNL